jgi:hypothetical protein
MKLIRKSAGQRDIPASGSKHRESAARNDTWHY